MEKWVQVVKGVCRYTISSTEKKEQQQQQRNEVLKWVYKYVSNNNNRVYCWMFCLKSCLITKHTTVLCVCREVRKYIRNATQMIVQQELLPLKASPTMATPTAACLCVRACVNVCVWIALLLCRSAPSSTALSHFPPSLN